MARMQPRLSRPVEHKQAVRRTTAFVALAGALWLSVVSPALADSATADALFRAGRQAADAGDHASAAARFAESQRLDPAAGTLLNLALAEEKLSRFASALDHASGAIDGLAKADPRLALAKALRSRLETRVPRVRIRLASDAPAGTVVKRDDIELGSAALGLELPIDPGPHTIVVTAKGRSPASFTVDAKEGARTTIDVAPGPPEAAPTASVGKPSAETSTVAPPAASASATPSPAPSPPPPIEPARTSRAGIGLVVGGGAALVGSGVLGALVLQKKNVVADHCPAKRCDAEGLAAGDSGRTLSFASTVAFGVGVAATGVGVYLLVRKGDEGGRGTAALSVGPERITLTGRF